MYSMERVQCHITVCPSTHSNVEENGLLRCHALDKATEHDSILCAEVADIDWDGKNELILGTFGKVSTFAIDDLDI